jgi:hypothetical protein
MGLCGVNVAQTLKPRPAATEQNEDRAASQKEPESVDAAPIMMPMSVEAGTPIKVALDSEVRIRAVGQTIHGKTTEPVYAFDKLLIPVGTLVNGKVAAIDPVPKMTRTMQAANGNFSPARKVHVQFDELVMADGQTVALHTVASPAPDGVLRFVSANEAAKKKNKVQEAASNKVSAMRQAIHQQWSDLQNKIHESGKECRFSQSVRLPGRQGTKTSVCLQKGTPSPPEYGSARPPSLCDPPRLSRRSLSSVCLLATLEN